MIISLSNMVSRVPQIGEQGISLHSESFVSLSKNVILDSFNTKNSDGTMLSNKDIRFHDEAHIYVNGRKYDYDDLSLDKIIVLDKIPTLIVKECINSYMLYRCGKISFTEVVTHAHSSIFNELSNRPTMYGLNETRYSKLLTTLDEHVIALVVHELSTMLKSTMVETNISDTGLTFTLDVINQPYDERFFHITTILEESNV